MYSPPAAGTREAHATDAWGTPPANTSIRTAFFNTLLRFNHEEFCDGEKPIAKLSRSPFSSAQALLLIAGERLALPESRPLGLPGDLPQGFGGLAGVPKPTKSAETPRWTRIGVRCPASS